MNDISKPAIKHKPAGRQINLGTERERAALWAYLDDVCLDNEGLLWQASEAIKQAQELLRSGEAVNHEELAPILTMLANTISMAGAHLEGVVEILGDVATAANEPGNEPDASPGPILSTAQAASLLHCSVKTIEERLRTGDLPGEKYGDSWILPGEALIERVNEVAKAKAAERRLVRSTPPPLAKVVKPRYRPRLKQLIGEV